MAQLKRSVRLDIDSSDSAHPILLCPRCQSRNLHHANVTVFNRMEDQDTVVVSITDGKETKTNVLPNDKSGNPSTRRDGLAIRFWCEGCGGDTEDKLIELTFAQHKGDTEIA